jgi:type IV pilus assembly protein PilQ
MKAKRPPSSSAAVSPWRVLAGAALISAVLWWLNWVRVGAEEPSAEEAPAEVASLPAGSESEALRLAATGPQGMDKLVSLDLRSTEATDALKYLALQGSLNISISKDVSGRVNLLLTDVPIRDVFDLILRSNQLAYDKQGNVYHVMTEDEYRTLYGKKFSDMRQVRTFRLQYAIPQQAFNLLDTLKSEIGRLLVDEDSGTVMVMDTPERLRAMEEALAVMEQSGTAKVIDLKYAKAKDIEERLKDQLEVNKLGFVRADERSNQLLIKTLPERMKELEDLIGALDRKTREVLIDARIVKVTHDNKLDSGIDWDKVFTNLKFHGIDQLGTDNLGNFRNTTAGTAPSEVPAVTKLRIPDIELPGSGTGNSIKLGNLAFGTVARDGYELFRFLETIGRTKVISNPRLMVTENQQASILVGTREAYVTTTTTSGQTTSSTAEDVEFIDVGIQLAVTPTINRDGFVTMKIKPEISSVVRSLTTPSGNTIPIVDTSTAETNVMVADGSTVIIGGLRKNEKAATNKQVPYLGHVPVLGPLLFKQVNRDDVLTELVVFITPHIVSGQDLVTGDEQASGQGFKSFRDYAPLRQPR